MRKPGYKTKKWFLENAFAVFLSSIPWIGVWYVKSVNTAYKMAEYTPRYEWFKSTLMTEFPMEFSIQIPAGQEQEGEALYRIVREACSYWNNKIKAPICYATKNNPGDWTSVPIYINEVDTPKYDMYLAIAYRESVPGMILRTHINVARETLTNYPITDTKYHYSWVSLMAHEVGHCFGLGHSDNPSSIMYYEMDMKNDLFQKMVLIHQIDKRRHRKLFKNGTMEKITSDK